MDAIKKKMQAMKGEKDNLMDRCDACEQVIIDNNNDVDVIDDDNYNVLGLQRCQNEKGED